MAVEDKLTHADNNVVWHRGGPQFSDSVLKVEIRQ